MGGSTVRVYVQRIAKQRGKYLILQENESAICFIETTSSYLFPDGDMQMAPGKVD